MPPRPIVTLVLILLFGAPVLAPLVAGDAVRTATTGLARSPVSHAAIWDGRQAFVFENSRIDRYDPLAAAGSTVSTSLDALTGRSAVYDGERYAYLFGGRSFQGTISAGIQRFDTWTGLVDRPAASLPKPLYGTVAVWADGVAYIAGGEGPFAPPEDPTSADVYEWDPATGLVTDVGNLGAGVFASSAVWTGSEMLTFGGQYCDAVHHTSVDHNGVHDNGYTMECAADDVIQTWSPDGAVSGGVLALRDAKYWTAAAWDGSQAIVFGGATCEPQGSVDEGMWCAPRAVADVETVTPPGFTGSHTALPLPLMGAAAVQAGPVTLLIGGVEERGDDWYTAPPSVRAHGPAPATPTAPRATRGPGAGEITVAWTPPSNTATGIVGYRVYSAPQGSATATFVGNATGPDATSFIHQGLPPGEARIYYIAAANAGGEGTRVVTAAARSPSAPTAPASPAAVMGPAAHQISVSWMPPADDGGRPITGYRVLARAPGGPSASIAELSASSRAVTEGGLANGEAREYAVLATNEFGDGAATGWSLANAPSVPSPPASVAASFGPGVGNVTLAWAPPAQTSGLPVLGYRVYAGDASGPLTLLDQTGIVPSFRESGLAPGQARTYEVAALTEAGEGARSTPATGSAPAAPSAPRSLVASSGPTPGNITLFWTPPEQTWGLTIVGYRVYAGDDGRAPSFLADVPNMLSFRDSGLAAGQERTYEVAAMSEVGEGTRSETATARESPPPSPPTNLVAGRGPGRGEITLTWDPPASTSGFPVDAYRIYRLSEEGETLIDIASPDARSFVDGELPSGALQRYSIAAVNAMGEGARAEATGRTYALPSPPTSARVAPAGIDATNVEWGPSASTDGLAPSFVVHRSATEVTTGSTGAWCRRAVTNGLSYSDADFSAHSTYRYAVATATLAGESALALAQPFTTAGGPLVGVRPGLPGVTTQRSEPEATPPASASGPGELTFDCSAEGFRAQNPQPASAIGWNPYRGRIDITADRRDALDESMARPLGPGFLSFDDHFLVRARWGVASQGNWQTAYPLVLAGSVPWHVGSEPGVVSFAYQSQDSNMGQPVRYVMNYRDGFGELRINESCELAVGAVVTLEVEYESGTLSMRLEDSAGELLLEGSHFVGSTGSNGFAFEDLLVATSGAGMSNEPVTQAWLDDIRVER